MTLNKRTFCCQRGFTLLELLIAIALMDIIALTLYSSMYIGFRAKKNSQNLLKPYQTVNPAFEVMREDLFNALTPDGILAGVFLGENVPWDNGQDSDTLSFFCDGYSPKEGEIASNIIKVGYMLDTDTVRKQIVLKRLTTKNLLAPSEVEPEEEVICRNLVGFDVQYYDGTSWMDEWDSAASDNQLPRGVRVTLTLYEENPGNASRADDYDPFRDYTRTFMLGPSSQASSEEEAGQGTGQGSGVQ